MIGGGWKFGGHSGRKNLPPSEMDGSHARYPTYDRAVVPAVHHIVPIRQQQNTFDTIDWNI
jgi:hypothetical protein